MSLSIDNLVRAVPAFRKHVAEIKDKNPPSGFTWYGYDILSNIYHLDKLLSGKNKSLFNEISRGYIADIGAADGDMSYFFETQGFKPHIIDFSPSNWNGLKGARALKTSKFCSRYLRNRFR